MAEIEWPDADFIGYCEIHSQTERALFHNKHIGRLLELAGDPFNNAKDWMESDGFTSADLSEHCSEARLRLERAKIEEQQP